MFRTLLGITVCSLPLTINLMPLQAQSWQDWVKNNPTYQQPKPTPSPSGSRQASPSRLPVQPKFSPDKTQPGSPASAQDISTHHPVFEQQFLAGCRHNSGNSSYCQCALKEIQNTYTIQEVVTIAEFMQANGEIPREIYNVALNCMS